MPEPYWASRGLELYCGDAREIASGLEFDAVLTDPPYGIGADYGGYDDSPEAATELCRWVVGLGKPTLMTFTSERMWDLPRPEWTAVWHKPMAFGWGRRLFLPHWEPILAYHMKGTVIPRSDVFRYNTEPPQGHPYTKPLPLWADLLKRLPGRVLDPFAGSGTTLLAAQALGRPAIAIEQNEEYCAVAVQRLLGVAWRRRRVTA